MSVVGYMFVPARIAWPRFNKEELLESISNEYEGLGRPLHAQVISPHEVLQLVSGHFAAAAGSGTPSPLTLESATPPAEEAAEWWDTCMYTVEPQEDGWHLLAWNESGETIADLSLPEAQQGFYALIMLNGTLHLHGVDAEPIPCNQYVQTQAENAATEGPAFAPPGVAPRLPEDEAGRNPVSCLRQRPEHINCKQLLLDGD